MKKITLILIAQLLFSIAVMAQPARQFSEQTQDELILSPADPLATIEDIRAWIKQQNNSLSYETSPTTTEIASSLWQNAEYNQVFKTFYKWENNTWEHSSSSKTTHDENGLILSEEQYRNNSDGIELPTSRVLYRYDLAGRLIYEGHESWDIKSSAWIKERKNEKTFNASGHLINAISSRRINNTLRITSKYLLQYDTNGNLLETNRYSLTNSGEQFIHSHNEAYTYDTQSRLINRISSTLRGTLVPWRKMSFSYNETTKTTTYFTLTDGVWKPGPRLVETFNQENTASELIGIYLDSEGNYNALYKISKEYDRNGYTTTEMVHSWNQADSTWLKSYKDVWAYTEDGKKTLEVNYYGLDDQWTAYAKYSVAYTEFTRIFSSYSGQSSDPENWYITGQSYREYDLTGNIKDYYYRSRWSENDTWFYGGRTSSSLNEAGLVESAITQRGTQEGWLNTFKTTYVYASTVGTEPVESPSTSGFTLNHYPNPATETSNISFDLTQPADISLELYDLLGRRIKSIMERKLPAGGHSVQVELSDLPNGVYFYRLSAGDEVQSAKVLVMN